MDVFVEGENACEQNKSAPHEGRRGIIIKKSYSVEPSVSNKEAVSAKMRARDKFETIIMLLFLGRKSESWTLIKNIH